MPARLSVYLPDDATLVRILIEGATHFLGRAPDCEVPIQHASVSRRHASLLHDGGSWLLSDLASKNGMRIDGMPATRGKLTDGQWFSLGDVFCQFQQIGVEQVAALGARAEQRRRTSQAWTLRLQQAAGAEALLTSVVSAIVELAECRRGLLLIGGSSGPLRVRACYRIDPSEIDRSRFLYSNGAVARALAERRPVFLSTPGDAAWLKQRESVVAGNLRVLACLPLLHRGGLLGVVYADSDEDGKLLTELDAEILTAFADQAALALAAQDLQRELARLETWVRVTPGAHRLGVGRAPAWHAPAGAVAQ
jgi:hypothetical protein